ncbi:MAG: CdaR family protein [Lachnospiraceae bacterium]|nr:CdaR family protein [Lachnospiraceae bacterium]MDD7668993.1 CdaR family protein [Lachnospiraceae bacterium]MDY2620332.1 CdaR family protein [Agathobacter sp.]
MGNKILKTLTKNLGFKILAVVFAFILWLVVYNTDDPTITVSYTTNVTVENASTVTDMNKCYEVLNGTNTVSFAVTAKRSVLNKLEDTDFTAVADMNRMIVNEDGDKANVPIEITSKRSNSSLKYNGKNKYLEVSLEDLMKRRFIITADTSGKVADGYALGEVTVTNPNVLNVSGPASIVNKIDSVVATIDVDGMSMNLSDNVIPALYDADGQEIDTTKLKLSNTTVTISAKILSVKEIPLVFSTSGVPYGDNRVVEISSKPETIKVKGSSTTLNPLSSLNIPGDVLNVSGASEDITTTIDISEYLPDGVELVNASDATVTVTVRIEAYELKKFNLSTSQINVNGLDSNYDLSFDQSTVAVTVSGLKNDLNKLNTRQLSASIDVTDLGVGTHQVNLDLNLDEDNYAYQTITVTIEIKDKTKNDSENTDDNSSENDSESEGQQDQNE